jgi:hypothetical protein
MSAMRIYCSNSAIQLSRAASQQLRSKADEVAKRAAPPYIATPKFSLVSEPTITSDQPAASGEFQSSLPQVRQAWGGESSTDDTTARAPARLSAALGDGFWNVAEQHSNSLGIDRIIKDKFQATR